MADTEKATPQVPKASFIKNAVAAFKDTARLKILQPVKGRLLKRYAEIEALSKAQHISIPVGNTVEWHTEPPKLQLAQLEMAMRDGKGVISYQVYKTDENGERAYRSSKRESIYSGGKEVEHDRQYIIEKTVVETIEQGKPIKVEEFLHE